MLRTYCRPTRTLHPSSWTVIGGFALFVALAATSCGSDDGTHKKAPTPTQTPTATAQPTPTATPIEPPHTENLFGSTEAGGGALTIDPQAEVHVFFSACIGGTGPDCTNGLVVYTGTDPGFEQAEEDEPDEPLYVLTDGTPVSLEVVSIDDGVSLHFPEGTLDAAGQSLVLGTTPGIHADLEWQLTSPGGDSAARTVRLKLTTTASAYTESEPVTFTLTPSTGQPDDEPQS
jgi:hypothetical protein